MAVAPGGLHDDQCNPSWKLKRLIILVPKQLDFTGMLDNSYPNSSSVQVAISSQPFFFTVMAHDVGSRAGSERHGPMAGAMVSVPLLCCTGRERWRFKQALL